MSDENGVAVVAYDLDGTRTPPEFYEALNERYKFVIDLFASVENTKTNQYFTRTIGLGGGAFDTEWPRLTSGWCWSNPPYSRGNLPKFVQKVVEQAKKGSGIVSLIPATPGTEWFNNGILRRCDTLSGHTVDDGPIQGYCLSMCGNGYRQEVTFLKGRIQFLPPIGYPEDKEWSSPATDSILWVVRPPMR